jgi:hypothetical protein
LKDQGSRAHECPIELAITDHLWKKIEPAKEAFRNRKGKQNRRKGKQDFLKGKAIHLMKPGKHKPNA